MQQKTQRHTRSLLALILILISALLLSACSSDEEKVSAKEAPAYVEVVEGSEYNRVVLTEKASQRLDLQTGAVTEQEIDGVQRSVVPYSAVIYGLNGETWIYVNPEPLTFIRTPVTIDFIEGDFAVLTDGPSSGTQVAMVGAALLYGIDTGVGK